MNDTDLWSQPFAFEEVYVMPFQPPSKELFDLLAWLNEAQRNLSQYFEYGPTQLYALGELTPHQIESLLTRGRV